MAKDHFIPASLIALFSEESGPQTRKRKVWTARSNGSRAKVRAEALGYVNRLYDVDKDMFPTLGSRAVDNVWSSYEPQLPEVLNSLINRTVTASEWIDTILPFVSAPFGRDRGYKTRVTSRLTKHTSGDVLLEDLDMTDLMLTDTNIALNRLLELERFAVRALASDWEVIEVDGDLVLPDLGYGFDLIHEYPDILMLLYPIGPRHLLTLTPCPKRHILRRAAEGWTPNISYARSRVSSSDINRLLTRTAQDFVVGSNVAIEKIRTEDFAHFDWEGIDQVLEQWPFNIDTLSVSGLYRVVQDVVHGRLTTLDGVVLNRHRLLSELEPNVLFVAPTGHVRADQVLAFDENGLLLSAHRL